MLLRSIFAIIILLIELPTAGFTNNQDYPSILKLTPANEQELKNATKKVNGPGFQGIVAFHQKSGKADILFFE